MPDPEIIPSSLIPRPGYEWTDEDIDAAGRAGDMAFAACTDAQALVNGFARDGWQTVIDFADGACQELFDLLARVATPTERPDESVSAEFFARLDAMPGGIERLRAEVEYWTTSVDFWVGQSREMHKALLALATRPHDHDAYDPDCPGCSPVKFAMAAAARFETAVKDRG